jgi:hypothetical protein
MSFYVRISAFHEAGLHSTGKAGHLSISSLHKIPNYDNQYEFGGE